MNSLTNNGNYARQVITPETAREWLLMCNHKNRNISQQLVNRISQAIGDGQWVYNGQPIIFDASGGLIDGQHRLAAIVKSGIAVESLVVSDVTDERAFATEDDGKKRTLADNLGASGVRHASSVASIGRIFYWIYHCPDLSRYRLVNKSIPHLKMMDFISQTPSISEAARMALKCRRICPVSLMGAALTALMLINKDRGLRFFDMFIEDDYDYRNHPVKKLKERLTNDTLNTKARLSDRDKLALIFKAWNGWLEGKAVKDLRFRSTETFPVPRGWS